MGIFGGKKKMVEELPKTSAATPNYIKVGYDEKHNPVEVSPAHGPDLSDMELCAFTKNDKEMIFQWFDYLNRYLEALRQEIHQGMSVPTNFFDKLNAIETEIVKLRQISSSPEKLDRLRSIQTRMENLRFPDVATRSDVDAAKSELLKTINDSVVSKEELVDSIIAKLKELRTRKKTKKISAEDKEKMIKTIKNVVNVALKVKPDERVLVVSDRKMIGLGGLFYRVVREVNPKTILMVISTASRNGEEPDESTADAMKDSDLVIIVSYKSMTHTAAVRNAVSAGVRVVSMPSLPKFSLIEGGMTADFNKVKENTSRMILEVSNADIIELTAPNGTNLKFCVGGREWLEEDCFIDESGKHGNLPDGEVSVGPLEKSINGVVVFDHFEFAKGKLELTVKEGVITKIRGKKRKLMKIFNLLGPEARVVGEFGIGCNQYAKIIGNTLEDEKVFGTVHIGLGNNEVYGGENTVKFHTDGIIENPTVKVDGRVIIKDGKWMIG